MLPSQSAEEAEAELKALANQGIFLTDENLMETDALQVQTTSKPEAEHQLNNAAGLDEQAVEDVVVHAAVVDEAATTSTSSLMVASNLTLDGPPSPNLRSSSSTCKSGPQSPVSAVGRKRKSRDDLPLVVGDATGNVSSVAVAGILQDEAAAAASLIDSDLKRKNSLRGFSTVGSSAGSKNTRFKRPKTTSAI